MNGNITLDIITGPLLSNIVYRFKVKSVQIKDFTLSQIELASIYDVDSGREEVFTDTRQKQYSYLK